MSSPLKDTGLFIIQHKVIFTCTQASNWGVQGGEAHLENFSPPLKKCVGHIWASLRKLFASPSVPAGYDLRAPLSMEKRHQILLKKVSYS